MGNQLSCVSGKSADDDKQNKKPKIKGDNRLPTKPTNIRATNITSTSLVLHWDKSTVAPGAPSVDGYRVRQARQENGVRQGGWKILTREADHDCRWEVEDLLPDTAYVFSVEGENDIGFNQMDPSDISGEIRTLKLGASDAIPMPIAADVNDIRFVDSSSNDSVSRKHEDKMKRLIKVEPPTVPKAESKTSVASSSSSKGEKDSEKDGDENDKEENEPLIVDDSEHSDHEKADEEKGKETNIITSAEKVLTNLLDTSDKDSAHEPDKHDSDKDSKSDSDSDHSDDDSDKSDHDSHKSDHDSHKSDHDSDKLDHDSHKSDDDDEHHELKHIEERIEHVEHSVEHSAPTVDDFSDEFKHIEERIGHVEHSVEHSAPTADDFSDVVASGVTNEHHFSANGFSYSRAKTSMHSETVTIKNQMNIEYNGEKSVSKIPTVQKDSEATPVKPVSKIPAPGSIGKTPESKIKPPGFTAQRSSPVSTPPVATSTPSKIKPPTPVSQISSSSQPEESPAVVTGIPSMIPRRGSQTQAQTPPTSQQEESPSGIPSLVPRKGSQTQAPAKQSGIPKFGSFSSPQPTPVVQEQTPQRPSGIPMRRTSDVKVETVTEAKVTTRSGIPRSSGIPAPKTFAPKTGLDAMVGNTDYHANCFADVSINSKLIK